MRLVRNHLYVGENDLPRWENFIEANEVNEVRKDLRSLRYLLCKESSRKTSFLLKNHQQLLTEAWISANTAHPFLTKVRTLLGETPPSMTFEHPFLTLTHLSATLT